jgi:hypothetical protein
VAACVAAPQALAAAPACHELVNNDALRHEVLAPALAKEVGADIVHYDLKNAIFLIGGPGYVVITGPDSENVDGRRLFAFRLYLDVCTLRVTRAQKMVEYR